MLSAMPTKGRDYTYHGDYTDDCHYESSYSGNNSFDGTANC
jgi:hypothetical protein